jgi:hypothetical protein
MAFQDEKMGDETDERGEHHQQEADAVDADQIFRADAGNPVRALHHPEADRFIEARDQRQWIKARQKPYKVRPTLMRFSEPGISNRIRNRPAARKARCSISAGP